MIAGPAEGEALRRRLREFVVHLWDECHDGGDFERTADAQKLDTLLAPLSGPVDHAAAVPSLPAQEDKQTGTYNCPICGWSVPHREHAGEVIEQLHLELNAWKAWWQHVVLMLKSVIRPGCSVSQSKLTCDELIAGRGASSPAPFISPMFDRQSFIPVTAHPPSSPVADSGELPPAPTATYACMTCGRLNEYDAPPELPEHLQDWSIDHRGDLVACAKLLRKVPTLNEAVDILAKTLKATRQASQTSTETGQKMAGSQRMDTARTCAKCGHLWGSYEDTCHCNGPCHNVTACSLYRMVNCSSCGGSGWENGNGFAGKPCPACQKLA